jgi:hypothetical protein
MSKLIRRYRKKNMERALKELAPVFTLDPADIVPDLVEGRW